mmetsp:Transcript_49113/g.81514  ORF Transcript_49113/g.81514 Transcript_49113/m.81514 type:complete len:638 (+) Transcript_49113:66-1979(+)
MQKSWLFASVFGFCCENVEAFCCENDEFCALDSRSCYKTRCDQLLRHLCGVQLCCNCYSWSEGQCAYNKCLSPGATRGLASCVEVTFGQRRVSTVRCTGDLEFSVDTSAAPKNKCGIVLSPNITDALRSDELREQQACSAKESEPSCIGTPSATEATPWRMVRARAALVAAAWGTFSASSFVAGAGLGVAGLAGSRRTRAKLMAFGGGALTEATSIELFGHVVHEDREYPGVVLVLIVAGLLGGVFFKSIHDTLHWLLEKQKKAALAQLLESRPSSPVRMSNVSLQDAQRTSHTKAAHKSMPAEVLFPPLEAAGQNCVSDSSGDAHHTPVNAPATTASDSQVMSEDVPAGAEPGQTTLVATPNGSKVVMNVQDARESTTDLVPQCNLDSIERTHNTIKVLPKVQSAMRRLLSVQRTANLNSGMRTDADGALTPVRKWHALCRCGSMLRQDAKKENASESMVEESRNSEMAFAFMVWLGSLLDAIPESFVLGILCVDGLDSDETTDGSMLAFVAACFVANLPEAMSASATLRSCGFSLAFIFGAWFAIVCVTSLGACLGAVVFGKFELEGEDHSNNSGHYGITFFEGVCGGMMWTMVANTILPEAYESAGGSGTTTTGIWSLMGFAAALAISIAPDIF